MRRTLPLAALPALLLIALARPAEAQLRNLVDLDRFDGRLAGSIVDHTANHGADRRVHSAILGRPRDLYVYLPPGYSPGRAYPLILFLHMSRVDEHALIGFHQLRDLDDKIVAGEVPPVVVACPDGLIGGENRLRSEHSFYVDGASGRFADHLMLEVLPFLERTYSLRPGREARGLLGTSAGGFGAMSLALSHRETFGSVAVLAAPLNMRYSNVDGRPLDDFDPCTFRWMEHYDPDAVVGRSFGVVPTRARKYIEPVFGDPPGVESRIARVNPADLIASTDLRPGELSIYVGYAGRDNYNFDAHAESFLWLLSRRGVPAASHEDPLASHSLLYFRRNLPDAYCWLGRHLAPPVGVAAR